MYLDLTVRHTNSINRLSIYVHIHIFNQQSIYIHIIWPHGLGIPYLSQHYSICMMEMVWGVTVMLVLAAASVRADDLHLDEMQDELLGGEYYPDNSNSTWHIKFSARVEGEEIMSACEIWTAQQGDLAEVTALKIPYRNKYSRKVDHMHTRVIRTVKATARDM